MFSNFCNNPMINNFGSPVGQIDNFSCVHDNIDNVVGYVDNSEITHTNPGGTFGTGANLRRGNYCTKCGVTATVLSFSIGVFVCSWCEEGVNRKLNPGSTIGSVGRFQNVLTPLGSRIGRIDRF